VRIILTAACALYLSGAHWMVLQMTAWTGMLAMRAPQVGLVAAVETTFSGEKPCSLCSAVNKGQKREQQPESQALKSLKEVQFVMVEQATPPTPFANDNLVWVEVANFAHGRADAPPTPPPKRA
jgi:hypothetical protein